MPKRYINNTFEVTKEQIEILTGSLLGDGCLIKVKGNNNSYFSEIHSLKQYDYLQWKHDKLLPFSKPIIIASAAGRKIENNKVVPDYNKILHNCTLRTISQPFLTQLEKKWYLRDSSGNYIFKNNRRIKIIPSDLVLTPLIIAVWFFDDGTNTPKRRAAGFCTQSFSKDECYFLTEKLLDFGIKCRVQKTRNNFGLYAGAESYLDLINLITPYVPCECMRYKVDLSEYTIPLPLSPIFSRKISEETAIEIMNLAKNNISTIKIAKLLNVSNATVDRLRFGKSWKHLTNGERFEAIKSKNGLGITGGVTESKRCKKIKYYVSISLSETCRVHLGIFDTLEEAVEVRKVAELLKDSGCRDKEAFVAIKNKYLPFSKYQTVCN